MLHWQPAFKDLNPRIGDLREHLQDTRRFEEDDGL